MRTKKIPLTLKILALILAAAIVFFIVNYHAGGFVYTVSGRISSVTHKKSSEKFSVPVDDKTIKAFEPYGDGFVTLSEDGISYINKRGETSFIQQLSYSNPAISICKNNIIAFDRGKTSYTVFKNSNVSLKLSTDENIIDADISSLGDFVIAVRNEKGKNVVYGLDSNGSVIYEWICPNGYITDAAIFKKGEKAAVTVIDSQNAVISSKVYVLDFNYDEAYAEIDFKDETVIGLEFLSKDKLQVITDKGVKLIDKKDSETVYEYKNSKILLSDFNEDRCAVITEDYSGDDRYFLVVFGKDGELKSETPLTGKVKGLSLSEKSETALFSDKIETYSKKGKLTGSLKNMSYYQRVVSNGKFSYVLSSESIKKYPSFNSPGSKVSDDEPVTEISSY